jgi:aminobenzoyl-glutamate transport protein
MIGRGGRAQPMTEIKAAAPPTTMQRVLDVVERVGNKVPHPVIIFVILIGVVIVLSHIST